MKLETKFSFRDRVHIVALNRDGVVLGIYHNDQGTQFQVRYFDNGDARTIYFFEYELRFADAEQERTFNLK